MAASGIGARALHWVFRVSDRHKVVDFYKNILGMKVLRHEEFDKPCEAACNGPFDGKWSKTMMGYGSEDNHFVVELTYNYDTHEYKLGDDYQHIRIHSKAAAARAEAEGGVRAENAVTIPVPSDGYRYQIVDNEDVSGDPVQALRLRVSNLERSLAFWRDVLGMSIVSSSAPLLASLSFGDSPWVLELEQGEGEVDHGTAFGRVAFSVPAAALEKIQSAVLEASAGGGRVIKELVSLDTPGKATVQVVILGDPDGYEICFVGDEAFRELSKIDETADSLLTAAMENDKSMEWWLKKKARQQAAAAAAAAATTASN